MLFIQFREKVTHCARIQLHRTKGEMSWEWTYCSYLSSSRCKHYGAIWFRLGSDLIFHENEQDCRMNKFMSRRQNSSRCCVHFRIVISQFLKNRHNYNNGNSCFLCLEAIFLEPSFTIFHGVDTLPMHL